MFERLNERAREVIVLAGEEARKFGQRNVGTEHLLLGMLDERAGIAAQALRSLGLSADGFDTGASQTGTLREHLARAGRECRKSIQATASISPTQIHDTSP